ncbi:hypothetical protein BD779DRAFT_408472 [Infundibulicybe gibba]|nr:hypothetical protein BD779DRAFT_408472 [Infundibulicybe gibba]
MNLAPPPTPFPGFDNSSTESSPEEFLQFLREFISKSLSAGRIPYEATWITVITTLSDHLLASFNLPGDVPWSDLYAKVMLMDATLEVIHRVGGCVDGIFTAPGDVAVTLFARLFKLCFVLDLWLDAEPLDETMDITPVALRQKVFSVTIGILRCLGSYLTTSADTKEPGWQILRKILLECLNITDDLVSNPQPTSPIAIMIFSESRIHRLDDMEPPDPDAPLVLIIEHASQVPLVLSILLEISVNTITPLLLSQWFITDLTRRLFETLTVVFNYTFSCPTTSAIRARALFKIVTCINIYSKSMLDRTPWNHILYRLLRYRLDEGPLPGWDVVDKLLCEIYCEGVIVSPTKAEVMVVISSLQTEVWRDAHVYARTFRVQRRL